MHFLNFKIFKIFIMTLTGLSTISTTTWADTPPMVVWACISCHGVGGSSLGPATPTIAGREKETFIEIMEAYKNDERPSTIMGRIAKGYTEADFEVMADYFNKQPVVRYSQNVDPDKAEMGKKLHQKYCRRCHAEAGYVDEDGTGILAGQWMPYLQFSLADFQSGVRYMPKTMKKRMQKMVKRYGEESLDNIVHFYSSQP